MNTRRIGFDIGGIIIDRVNDGTDTSFFGDNYLATTAVPGAFDTIRNARESFGDKRYLVSKCGARTQERAVQWLAQPRPSLDFHTHTGIPAESAYFTRTRVGKCAIAETLSLTDFVDDRLEVLGHLVGLVKRLYLLNAQDEEVAKHQDALPHVIVVQDMYELDDLLSSRC
ncbi:MAG: hypothetical protein WBP12_00095 [Candidatus Saccharimonas sp.]